MESAPAGPWSCLVAGGGIAPPISAYETDDLLLVHPASLILPIRLGRDDLTKNITFLRVPLCSRSGLNFRWSPCNP